MSIVRLVMVLAASMASVLTETSVPGEPLIDHEFSAELVLPAFVKSEHPQPGAIAAITPPEFAGTCVFHTVYLPDTWTPDGPALPIIFEYTGNFFPRSGSTGEPEDAALGFGLSQGKFIWVSLPFVSADLDDNSVRWWGAEKATVEYAKRCVPQMIKDFHADQNAVFLCGFSRGAIGVNYIGLHDDEIAKLWSAFITHDHFDGIKEWKGTAWGSPLADYQHRSVQRLRRVGGRPYLVCQSGSGYGTEEFVAANLDDTTNFTFLNIDMRSIFGDFPHVLAKSAHTDRWPLLPSEYRKQAWRWMNTTLSTIQH